MNGKKAKEHAEELKEQRKQEAEERKQKQQKRWEESLRKRPPEVIKIINDKWKEQGPILWVDRRNGTKAIGAKEVKGRDSKSVGR